MAKTSRKASPRAHAAYQQLYRAFGAVDRAHERWLTSVGSNGARYAVLAALSRSERPMTPSDVSDDTGRSPNAISPLLRALHEEGLIKRAPNAADRRSHYLALTAPGRRMVQRLERQEQAFIQAALGGQSVKSLNTLQESLRAVEDQALTIQRSH
jgi:DNA-binding MarR family transcriptional regulator